MANEDDPNPETDETQPLLQSRLITTIHHGFLRNVVAAKCLPEW